MGSSSDASVSVMLRDREFGIAGPSMIAIEETVRIATDAAVLRLGRNNVVTALIEPIANSRGDDALRVVVVITNDAMERLGGDAFLAFLVEINRRLQDAGDERFPIVEYATEDELRDDDDPEP